MTDLIVGTAGHIDHGKTALVRALTGIDTDRFAQEKSRGISIDIGFAHLDLGDDAGRRVGIVDVPGHERFIKNMLAGAAGVDVALLVVAADDAVMPQTREHLAILELLEVSRGLIALTKVDLVEPAWLDLVETDVRELVAGTFLADAPIVRVSAKTGVGLDDVRATLTRFVDETDARARGDVFRMAVDRSFLMQGLGTVVTGTVWSGVTRVGDELEWLPAGKRVRVRGVQSHGVTVEQAGRGQRAALDLSGAHHAEIGRGHELATPGFLVPSEIVTVSLRVLPDSPWPIKHRARVRLHLGTDEVMARVTLLDGTALAPGATGLAQLHCARPVVAQCQQPFVVRAESPLRTLGGGSVLEPVARRLTRRGRADHAALLRRASRDVDERVEAAMIAAGTRACSELDLCRDGNASVTQVRAVLERLRDAELLRDVTVGPQRVVRLHARVHDGLRERLLETLRAAHAAKPAAAGIPRATLVHALCSVDAALVRAMLEELASEGVLVGDHETLALASFTPTLTAAQRRLREHVTGVYKAAAFRPPEPDEVARSAGVDAGALTPIIELCVAQRDLTPLGGSLYLHRDWEADLTRRVRRHLDADGDGKTMSEIKDLLDTSRKYAVPICEYLDRVGVTRRVGDRRVLREP